jgi:hypothetical protein
MMLDACCQDVEHVESAFLDRNLTFFDIISFNIPSFCTGDPTMSFWSTPQARLGFGCWVSI